ncbi:MAG: hypothetical protein PVI40_04385 [Chlamydiota bacterium]|jgi:hypothetical protein
MRTEFANDLVGINLSLWVEACQHNDEPEELNAQRRRLANHFGESEDIIDQLNVKASPSYSFFGEKLLNIEIPKINLKEKLSINDLAKRCIRVLKDTSFQENERLVAGEIFMDDLPYFRGILDNKLQTHSLIFRIVVWARNLFSNWQIQSFNESYDVTFQENEDDRRTGVIVQSRKELETDHHSTQEVISLLDQIEGASHEMGAE